MFSSPAVGGDGNTVGPGFEEQLDYIFSEMKETLENLGSSMDELVEMTMYMVNMEREGKKVGRVWAKYIESTPSVA